MSGGQCRWRLCGVKMMTVHKDAVLGLGTGPADISLVLVALRKIEGDTWFLMKPVMRWLLIDVLCAIAEGSSR